MWLFYKGYNTFVWLEPQASKTTFSPWSSVSIEVFGPFMLSWWWWRSCDITESSRTATKRAAWWPSSGFHGKDAVKMFFFITLGCSRRQMLLLLFLNWRCMTRENRKSSVVFPLVQKVENKALHFGFYGLNKNLVLPALFQWETTVSKKDPH